MRPQEVTTFAEALETTEDKIATWDLLAGEPPPSILDAAHIVLVGGSGDYSAAANDPWLDAAFATMQNLYEQSKPTFASCWGFQAMGRALGGRTITDMERAELGVVTMQTTAEALGDVCFGWLGETFEAYQGHQDRVAELPPNAILLASSQRVPIQAFTFADRPIYATQFHPELSRRRFLERLYNYPEYIQKITGLSFEEFEANCAELTKPRGILDRFMGMVLETIFP